MFGRYVIPKAPVSYLEEPYHVPAFQYLIFGNPSVVMLGLDLLKLIE
jgi:hypothetical protein